MVSIKDTLQKPVVEALYLLSFKQIAFFPSMWCTADISRLRFRNQFAKLIFWDEGQCVGMNALGSQLFLSEGLR